MALTQETKRPSSIDLNTRPMKRQRLATLSEKCTPLPNQFLNPLPPAILLISLPALLVHPPNHPKHVQYLDLSLRSLRRCLSLQDLTADIECRAWTALAEIGLTVIKGGFCQSTEHAWAVGVENEVEKATTKGLLIAQKHPSLRTYRPHLTILSAQLAHLQNNSKYARNLLRRLLTTFVPSDPPHIVYGAHLALITHLVMPSQLMGSQMSPTRAMPPQDSHAVLDAMRDLNTQASRNGHSNVVLLAQVLRLRLLVSFGMWEQVETSLKVAEDALNLLFTAPLQISSTQQPSPEKSSSNNASRTSSILSPSRGPSPIVIPDNAFHAAMMIHVLILGVVFYTYDGSSSEDVAPRLTYLHAILDSGVLDLLEAGVVEIPFETSPPLYVTTTHPRILNMLAYLVTSVAKRDPVGRRPKRKVFATEGLVAWEKQAKKDIPLLSWAGFADVQEAQYRMDRIKGDLLCELVGVCIMRSEFAAAEDNLAQLIAHTRTADIFPSFAARVTLYHAYLAHAQGLHARALDCYRVAQELGYGGFVSVAARAGEVTLRIGTGKAATGEPDADTAQTERALLEECRGRGGVLRAVGYVLEACLCTEILKAKQCLKHALEIAGRGQDNHQRALILALIAAHYFHTAGGHAKSMLGACAQLAAGLGASRAGAGDAVGNAALRRWVGARFLELYRREGDEVRAERQAEANRRVEAAIEAAGLNEVFQ